MPLAQPWHNGAPIPLACIVMAYAAPIALAVIVAYKVMAYGAAVALAYIVMAQRRTHWSGRRCRSMSAVEYIPP